MCTFIFTSYLIWVKYYWLIGSQAANWLYCQREVKQAIYQEIEIFEAYGIWEKE